MNTTNIDGCGDMYLPIYRDGIPMLVPFRDLTHRDEVIREFPGEEIVVGSGGCKHGEKTFFFHDPRWNAWFPSDFRSQPVLLFAGNLGVDADICEINTVLARSDVDSALSELAKLGYLEDGLRERGFSFLYDILKLH